VGLKLDGNRLCGSQGWRKQKRFTNLPPGQGMKPMFRNLGAGGRLLFGGENGKLKIEVNLPLSATWEKF
jgi:hypothetical protein